MPEDDEATAPPKVVIEDGLESTSGEHGWVTSSATMGPSGLPRLRPPPVVTRRRPVADDGEPLPTKVNTPPTVLPTKARLLPRGFWLGVAVVAVPIAVYTIGRSASIW